MPQMDGGERVAEVLKRQGVRFLFTLCGGHISPILVSAKALGIRVIDVRHEVNAVFAADAVARLTGVPGVAAVTAGPGVTNTITAVKNAQMAQSPLVLLGGAAGTMIKGRGALQDIDQLSLFEPIVKRAYSTARVTEIVPTLERAFEVAREGVPGPVFVELPIDLLYAQDLVTSFYLDESKKPKAWLDRAVAGYLKRHVRKIFAGSERPVKFSPEVESESFQVPKRAVRRVCHLLDNAQRPVLVVGSQALLDPGRTADLRTAIERLGLPVYLSGMARGLLGAGHPLQRRHKRSRALRAADVVILAGVPCDFRLDYGRHVSRGAKLVSANRSHRDLYLNRRPTVAVHGDPASFLIELARKASHKESFEEWREVLSERDQERVDEIDIMAAAEGDWINPLVLCRNLERELPEDSVLVADGGDFVATASYTVSPRGPLRWLDPGAFGTLGVGGGFALGAKLCHPESEVWIVYGDGSAAYSLAEFDTFVRHGLPVIALIGNDACWAQIAREQVEILGDAVGTELLRTDYDTVAKGYGGEGLTIRKHEEIPGAFARARELCAAGKPVVINAWLSKTDFRKGSISM